MGLHQATLLHNNYTFGLRVARAVAMHPAYSSGHPGLDMLEDGMQCTPKPTVCAGPAHRRFAALLQVV